MDTFAKAREKYEKNRIGQKRDYPKGYVPEEATIPPVVATVTTPAVAPVDSQTPKERPQTDAIFTVSVSLPDKEMKLTITKANIYANVPKSRVTEAEMRKAICQGLEAMLGAVR